MAKVEDLMGVGASPEVAKRTGFFISTVVSTGTTIDGPGNHIVRVSTESLNLGTDFVPGDMVLIMPVTAATLAAASCAFNAGAASVANLTAGYPKLAVKTGLNAWLLLAGLTAAA